jgi:hypothetical protein
MFKLTLETAADYVRTSHAPDPFLAVITRIRQTFSFTDERANRCVRFLEIVRDYRAGIMINDIVAKHGCTRGTVLRYARLVGCPKRPKSDDPMRHAKILAMTKRKKRPSAADIAAACQCSIALVSKIEREAGLPRYEIKTRGLRHEKEG